MAASSTHSSPTHALSKLGPHLVSSGALDEASLARAESASRAAGERLDRALVRLGLASEQAVTDALAWLLGVPVAGPDDLPTTPVLSDAIPARFVRHARALPLGEDQEGVRLALADPLDETTARAVALRLGRTVRVSACEPSVIEAAIERLYGDADTVPEVSDPADEAGDVDRLRDLANEAPVIRLVTAMIAKAAEVGASDIHVEPGPSRMRVRLRVDGQLVETDPPPATLRAAVVSRLKIMAGLDIAERRLPQDGRIRTAVAGRPLDLRVATTPGLHGEGVVLRLLDKDAAAFDLAEVGLDGALGASFRSLIGRPDGIVLVTGPTGSGKTTTLYAALRALDTDRLKVVTVEDPVEYEVEGVHQIPVQPGIGLTFERALRSVLRQDPDVVMIGEVRDAETAQIAVQASLTGHLVLATLHTNSAAAAVGRMLDMGVQDYLLASTLSGVLAQRLVRRLCPACRVPHEIDAALTARFGGQGASDGYAPQGCPACRNTGYNGRVALAELMTVTTGLRRRLLQGVEASALAAAAQADGMTPLSVAGLSLVRDGVTSLAEVLRVTSGAPSSSAS